MTVHLSPASARRDAARRFGAELRRAMKCRRIGAKTLGPQVGMPPSGISAYLAGQNLPRLDTAQRLAASLSWPKLEAIAREGRMGSCVACGAAFVNEGGAPKRYCSQRCQAVVQSGRVEQRAARAAAIMALRGEMLANGPVCKQTVGRVLTVLDGLPDIAAARRLDEHMTAVAAFCGRCSPDGCPDAACELRAVSPLPLRVAEDRPVETAHPPLGRWGHPGAREAYGATMRARWADPETRPSHERGILAAQQWRREHPEEFAAAVSRGRRAR